MSNQPKHKTREEPLVNTGVGKSMRARLIFVVAVLLLFVCAVVAQLVKLQIVEHEKWKAYASAQQLADEVITPSRGTIYDAKMNILAESATVWTVTVSPLDMATAKTNIKDVAVKFSELLGLDAQEILDKLSDSESNYKLIKRQVTKDVVDAINTWVADYNKEDAHSASPVRGIYMVQDSKRYYPYSSLASKVLGFVNVDGDGLSGLEYYYNTTLSGVPGRVLTAKNALGYEMPVGDYSAEYDAQQGNSLVLTIDTTIQSAAEKYLKAAIEEHNVTKGGTCIVMNVKTGAILAMTSMPDYDLNDPYTIGSSASIETIDAAADEETRNAAQSDARQAQWRNTAVADSYEPGSVFKIVTASAALDSGSATLDTSFTCTGSIQVANFTMKCAHTEGHGTLDFYGGLNNSCNPYYIQLGQQMGAPTFCRYVSAYGFGKKTGIDLPSEAPGIVYAEAQMGITELSSCSFGQSISVTPLQMITAVSAAVNGGYLMQPYLVDQVLDENGNIVSQTTPTVRRQVISEEVSATMCSMLEESVSTGTNTKARVSGYRVGGKSGTAQKLNDSRDDEEEKIYVASFVAFAPANDPEVAVLVILDEPHSPSGSYFGGRLCGPVCSNILGEVLPYLGVDTQYSEEELAVINLSVPYLIDNSLSTAQSTLNGMGLNFKVIGSGMNITYQYPGAGTKLPRQSTVILYTDEGATGTMVTVPDTTGKSVALATNMLKGVGLNISVVGASTNSTTAVAESQSITVGEQVEMGTLIEVSFYDAAATD